VVTPVHLPTNVAIGTKQKLKYTWAHKNRKNRVVDIPVSEFVVFYQRLGLCVQGISINCFSFSISIAETIYANPFRIK
jgi:hypothetical protein